MLNFRLSSVNFPTMANLRDEDFSPVVIYLKDYAIVSHPNPVSVLESFQFAKRLIVRSKCEPVNGSFNP